MTKKEMKELKKLCKDYILAVQERKNKVQENREDYASNGKYTTNRIQSINKIHQEEQRLSNRILSLMEM